MKEYLVQGIVLDKEDWGDVDSRVFLYTIESGKIVVKLKSSKKPLSKLNGHLEPFNFVRARIIERGPQIVDALVIEKINPSWPLQIFFNFIKETTLEYQPDPYFWSLIKQALITQKIDYQKLLAIQGFDPKFALCQNCQQPNPSNFLFKDQDFWCSSCLKNQLCSTGFIELV